MADTENITPVIPTQRLSSSDQLLRDKYVEDFAQQSQRLDSLAQQLIVLELAIPGLYATALKLVSGDKATLSVDVWLWLTLGAWLLALLFSFVSLMPRRWQVDTQAIRGQGSDGALSIEAYFSETAKYKWRLLIVGSVLFFVGICTAAVSIF